VVWAVAPTPGVQLRERGLRGFWLEQETLLGDWKRARNWPKRVRWSLERRVHRGAMPDNLPNKDGLVIVSPRLKAFLQRAKVTNVEYLPISISDAPYFIVHPLRAQSAFDWKRSQFDQRAQRVTAVRKLVLDDATIRRPGSFFRVSSVESLVFLPRMLASAIAAAAFTGVAFTEIAQVTILEQPRSVERLRADHRALEKDGERESFDDFVSQLVARDDSEALALHYDLLRRRKNLDLFATVRHGFVDRGQTGSVFLSAKLAKETDTRLMADALLILGLLQAKSARHFARRFTEHPSPELRSMAATVLGWVGSANDLKTILRDLVLSDPRPKVRGAAAIALRQVWERMPTVKKTALAVLKLALPSEKNQHTVQCIVLTAQSLMNMHLGLRELLDEGAIDGDLGQARDKTLKALARA
jgi:hypothetical protein